MLQLTQKTVFLHDFPAVFIRHLNVFQRYKKKAGLHPFLV